MALELWLAGRGRCPRSDRRMLHTAARLLERLPAVRDAFRRRVLSWGQVRAIVLICERVPSHLLDAVDDTPGPHPWDLDATDPDAVVHLVRQAPTSLDATPPSKEGPPVDPHGRFLAIQPRLDGTGGRLFAELDAAGLAAVERATDPGPVAGSTRPTMGQEADPATRRHAARRLARARADRLVGLCAAALADGAPAGAGGDTDAPVPVAPTLLLTMTYDTLAGRDGTPAPRPRRHLRRARL